MITCLKYYVQKWHNWLLLQVNWPVHIICSYQAIRVIVIVTVAAVAHRCNSGNSNSNSNSRAPICSRNLFAKILPHEQFDFHSYMIFFIFNVQCILCMFAVSPSLSLFVCVSPIEQSTLSIVCSFVRSPVLSVCLFVFFTFNAISTSIHFDFILNLLDSFDP